MFWEINELIEYSSLYNLFGGGRGGDLSSLITRQYCSKFNSFTSDLFSMYCTNQLAHKAGQLWTFMHYLNKGRNIYLSIYLTPLLIIQKSNYSKSIKNNNVGDLKYIVFLNNLTYIHKRGYFILQSYGFHRQWTVWCIAMYF